MKVLLSAYACEPDKGSEPGVGWHWAIEIARLGHEVWVLTRQTNRAQIERGLSEIEALPGLHFEYYDLPRWARGWKRGARGIYLYYALWQLGAYRHARNLAPRIGFDRVHHITFGVFRHASPLGSLGREFVFGPVGGGETAPLRLRRHFGLRGFLLETCRDLANQLSALNIALRQTFSSASLILAKTPETLEKLPRSSRSKAKCQLEIGIATAPQRSPPADRIAGDFRILYAGRFVYWKGMGLGLRAFAQLQQTVPQATLTMVGEGPDEKHWRQLARKLGVASAVTWLPWLPRDRVLNAYADFDVLLFPSLHDSSGNVVLEAISQGLPVVCLDLGGPAQIVDKSCGVVVATGGVGEAEVIDGITAALARIAGSRIVVQALRNGARSRAQRLSWRSVVQAAGY
jgi:glycosyltransferase involved in cell wall biosynthesis